MFTRHHAARGTRVSLLAAMMAIMAMTVMALAPAGAHAARGANPADGSTRHGVNLASPAVVRIVSEVDGQVVCKGCASGNDLSFPLNGGAYQLAFSGSGAFISSDGYILTADHVVDYANNNQILLDFFQQAVSEFATAAGVSQNDAQSVFLELVNEGLIKIPTRVTSQKAFLSTAYTGTLTNTAQVTSYDITRIVASSPVEKQDTAIVKVEAHDMPYLKLAPANSIHVQDTITAVAFPGDADTGDFTALLSPSSGGNANTVNSLLSSSVNTGQVTGQKTFADGTPVYQTSGLANHGSSGGPVIDEQGRIIGVVDAVATQNGQDDTRVVYLIPSDIADQYVRQSGASSGGAFMAAWTKAITEYDATGPCHFTNAKRDLTGLKNSYPAFGGVTPYLTDAQGKATAAECPAPGPNIGLIAGISLGVILLLALVGVLLFVLTRRGRPSQAQPAIAPNFGATPGMTPNVYGPQTPSGGYAPPVSAPVPAGVASSNGAYTPTPQIPQTPQNTTPYAQTIPSGVGVAPYAAPVPATPQPQPYPPAQAQVYSAPAPTPTPQPQQPVMLSAMPATRICANGHAVADLGAHFCPECGAAVQ